MNKYCKSLDFVSYDKVFTKEVTGLKCNYEINFEHLKYAKGDIIPIERTVLTAHDGKKHHIYNELEKYFFTIRTELNDEVSLVGYALN